MSHPKKEFLIINILISKIIFFVLFLNFFWSFSVCKASDFSDFMDEKYLVYAKCVKQKNLTLFGADFCTNCRKQISALGEYFEYINYIDCSKNRMHCYNSGIRTVPTWSLPDGQKFIFHRTATLEDLARFAGCL